MLIDVPPSLKFWFYLAIISSPSWVFSFSAMDFVKKTSGLAFIFLISTLTLLCCAGNLVLSYFYLYPQTNRFFRGYECVGKTIGFVLVVLGNVGLCYFPEKSVACILTFLFLAFYCLCALFCIQPYTGFGALEFLLTASLNPTLRRFGLLSPYSWLVIIACIVIAVIRFCLQPVHPLERTTSNKVDEGQRIHQLEAGLSSPGAKLDNNEDPSPPTNTLSEDVKTDNEDPSPPGVRLDGVESTALAERNKNQIEVIGDGIDSVALTTLSRKNVGFSKQVNVGLVMEKKDGGDDEEDLEDGDQENDVAMEQIPLTGYYNYPYGPPDEYEIREESPDKCSIM